MNDENLYLTRYAFKSIQRNAGRSFFIIFSVSLAVFVAIWVVSFFEGLNTQIEQAVVNNNIGHYQLQDNNFEQTAETKYPLRFSDYQDKILKINSPFSPELILESNISTPEGAASLTLIGIIPEMHSKFLPLNLNMAELENEDSVIIGEELAKKFLFTIGDQLILNYQDHLGELRSELLTIVDIYRFSGPSFEKRTIYTHQKSFQKVFFNEIKDDILFNRVTFMTHSMKRGESILNENWGEKVKVKTWKDLNPEMAVVLDFHGGMIKFFFLIIGITIIMTILTPVQMLWQERLKELKMLRILGVTSKTFWKIGIFELLFMITLSFVMSMILLSIIIGVQSQIGVDFSLLHQGINIERAGILLPQIIYPYLSMSQVLNTLIFVTIVLSFCYGIAIKRTLKKLEDQI